MCLKNTYIKDMQFTNIYKQKNDFKVCKLEF